MMRVKSEFAAIRQMLGGTYPTLTTLEWGQCRIRGLAVWRVAVRRRKMAILDGRCEG
jgi:hypothetical protein